jgi:hypothetical protein
VNLGLLLSLPVPLQNLAEILGTKARDWSPVSESDLSRQIRTGENSNSLFRAYQPFIGCTCECYCLDLCFILIASIIIYILFYFEINKVMGSLSTVTSFATGSGI